MSRRNITLLFVCLTLLVFSFSNSAQAARRSALGSNLLIEDKDDVFFFPQLLLDYRDMIALDYGPGDPTVPDDYSSGNALMLLGGEDIGFGLALHRGDLMSPELAATASEIIWLDGVQSEYLNIPGAAFTSGPATMVDLLFALALAPETALGFRLGFGRGAGFVTAGGDDTGGGETFVMAEGGLTIGKRPNGLRVDLGLDVLLDFADETDTGTDTYSGMSIKAAHTGRGFYPLVGALELGFLWGLGFNNNSISNEVDPTNPSYVTNRFNVAGGIGPAITLGPATIAGYALLGFDFSMVDPDSEVNDDNLSDLDFILPGALMSLEAQLVEWFYARTSAGYQYVIGSTTDDAGVDTSSLGGQFLWSAGIGIEVGGFAFDGTFRSHFITSGPDFLGGEGTGFLAMASVTYKFDLHAPPAATKEEPAPAVEAEPIEPVAPNYPEPPAETQTEGNAEGDAAASGAAGAQGGAAVEGDAEGSISGQMKLGL